MLTSGLNTTKEWGFYSTSNSSNAAIKTNGAPILLMWGIRKSYVVNSTIYDEIYKPDVIEDGIGWSGYGLSHAYVPSGSTNLTVHCGYGCIMVHGSKNYAYKPTTLTADHDGYMFLVSNVLKTYTTIKVNGTTLSRDDNWIDVNNAASGYGCSLVVIPVHTGDEVIFSNGYEYGVAY